MNHGPLSGREDVHRALQDYQAGYREKSEGYNRLNENTASLCSEGGISSGTALELTAIWDRITVRVRAFLICGFLVFHAASVLCAADPLQPPFGLSWGDSPTRLVDWATRTKLDQTVKAPADQPRLKILLVSPAKGTLPGHDATTLEARFMDGKLFEVALHYTYPGRTSTFVRAQFAELKKILSHRHGPLQLGAKTREEPLDGVVTRSTAYQIDPAPGSNLMLVMTQVSDAKRGDQSARFSVVYHNDSVLQQEGPRVIIRRDGLDLPGKP